MVEICNEYNICYIFRLKKNAPLLSLKENQINENNEIKKEEEDDNNKNIMEKQIEINEMNKAKKKGFSFTNKNDIIVEAPYKNGTRKLRILKYMYDEGNYYLATNIFDETMTIKTFADLYHDRWDEEEHFKVGKKCMKLGHFFEKSYVSLEKCLQSQIFMHSLVSIMEQEYRKVNKIEHTLVLNKPALLKGLYAELLIDFFFDEKKVTEIYLANFLKIYMQFNKKCKEGQHNPRKAKTPFSKWYTKGYLSKNNKNIRYEDIIDDEEFNDTE